MSNSIRQIRQEEATEAWLDSGMKSILMCSPRMGKTFCGVAAMRKLNLPVIIAYPRVDIKVSWIDTFNKLGYDYKNVQFTTFHGVKKLKDVKNHLVVVDECHELSLAQLREIDKLVQDNYILGLSGTITNSSERQILRETGLNICYHYPISQAVQEGVLADYQITVHKVSLDDLQPLYKNSKGQILTEKEQFRRLKYIADRTKDSFFIELKLISILQNSIAKIEKTKELLDKYKEERVLVFCGQTKIADSLGIPAYHSKAKEKELLHKFCNDEGVNQLACCQMLTAGITVKPIDKGILNYTSGSPENCAQKIARMLGTELNNPDKKAQIQIISSNEKFETDRITSALSFFDEQKIKYV